MQERLSGFTEGDAVPAIVVFVAPDDVADATAAGTPGDAAGVGSPTTTSPPSASGWPRPRELDAVDGDVSPPIPSEDGAAAQAFVPLSGSADLGEATAELRDTLSAGLPGRGRPLHHGSRGLLQRPGVGVRRASTGCCSASRSRRCWSSSWSSTARCCCPLAVLATSMFALCLALLTVWHLATLRGAAAERADPGHPLHPRHRRGDGLRPPVRRALPRGAGAHPGPVDRHLARPARLGRADPGLGRHGHRGPALPAAERAAVQQHAGPGRRRRHSLRDARRTHAAPCAAARARPRGVLAPPSERTTRPRPRPQEPGTARSGAEEPRRARAVVAGLPRRPHPAADHLDHDGGGARPRLRRRSRSFRRRACRSPSWSSVPPRHAPARSGSREHFPAGSGQPGLCHRARGRAAAGGRRPAAGGRDRAGRRSRRTPRAGPPPSRPTASRRPGRPRRRRAGPQARPARRRRPSRSSPTERCSSRARSTTPPTRRPRNRPSATCARLRRRRPRGAGRRRVRDRPGHERGIDPGPDAHRPDRARRDPADPDGAAARRARAGAAGPHDRAVLRDRHGRGRPGVQQRARLPRSRPGGAVVRLRLPRRARDRLQHLPHDAGPGGVDRARHARKACCAG